MNDINPNLIHLVFVEMCSDEGMFLALRAGIDPERPWIILDEYHNPVSDTASYSDDEITDPIALAAGDPHLGVEEIDADLISAHNDVASSVPSGTQS